MNPVLDRNPAPALDRATGPELPVPPSVRDAVERSAGIRRGLALLHRAPAEAVAAALGVSARAVEEARDRLGHRDERRHLLGLFARAVERRKSEPPASGVSFEEPRGPHDLVAEAERHALGLDFLRRAHPETVAVTFTVHPEVVDRARELLAARGPAPSEPGEEA